MNLHPANKRVVEKISKNEITKHFDIGTPTFSPNPTLLGGELSEASDGGPNSGAVWGAEGVRTTADGLCARVAAPDPYSLSAEGELTAEGAEVLGVLGDLELLGTLTGVGSVTGTIATHDAHLNSALGHPVC